MTQKDTSFQGPFTQIELAEAVAEFRSRGIMWPDVRQLEAAMERNREAKRRQAEARQAEAQAQPAEPMPAQPTPIPPVKCKRGRPQKYPWWLNDLAEYYCQGLPMLRALRKVGQGDLSKAVRKNIYRWKRFRQLVESYRGKYGIR